MLSFYNLGSFIHPTLVVSFRRDITHIGVPGVYARGSNKSHPGGKFITCLGLTELVISICKTH